MYPSRHVTMYCMCEAALIWTKPSATQEPSCIALSIAFALHLTLLTQLLANALGMAGLVGLMVAAILSGFALYP